MTEAESWTIGRLLTWTTEFLKSQKIESPRLDAELLLASSRGCARIELYTAFDQLATVETRNLFRDLVRRRVAGTPVAYLVGVKEFFSLRFEVTPDVLIPRPETELLVVTLLDRIADGGQDTRVTVADVGTGSGAIAVAVAKQSARCHVTAIDVSPPALAVAAGNARQHGVAERIEWVESDLFAMLPSDQVFDFVASNPPYVAEAEFAELAKEIRDYEPRRALVAGPRGTEVFARLIPASLSRLRDGGGLLLEIAPHQQESVCQMIDQCGGFATPQVIKDLAGHPRVVQAERRI
jgi:release factor glutamine methyltransferase